jgi:hypothetical protein
MELQNFRYFLKGVFLFHVTFRLQGLCLANDHVCMNKSNI